MLGWHLQTASTFSRARCGRRRLQSNRRNRLRYVRCTAHTAPIVHVTIAALPRTAYCTSRSPQRQANARSRAQQEKTREALSHACVDGVYARSMREHGFKGMCVHARHGLTHMNACVAPPCPMPCHAMPCHARLPRQQQRLWSRLQHKAQHPHDAAWNIYHSKYGSLPFCSSVLQFKSTKNRELGQIMSVTSPSLSPSERRRLHASLTRTNMHAEVHVCILYLLRSLLCRGEKWSELS